MNKEVHTTDSEKELNCHLFDQLDIVERLEEIAESGDMEAVKKELALMKKQIERKLYQQPPLTQAQP